MQRQVCALLTVVKAYSHQARTSTSVYALGVIVSNRLRCRLTEMQKSGMYEVYGKSEYNAEEQKGELFLTLQSKQSTV